jgi:hypothetical protein
MLVCLCSFPSLCFVYLGRKEGSGQAEAEKRRKGSGGCAPEPGAMRWEPGSSSYAEAGASAGYEFLKHLYSSLVVQSFC